MKLLYIFIVYSNANITIYLSLNFNNNFFLHSSQGESTSQSIGKTNRFDEREMKMTWSILIVFFCYIGCVAPISTLVFLNQKSSYYWILFTGLYLSLFILNFFVYSQQNEQYQKAFVDYLNMIKYFLMNGTLNGHRAISYKDTIKYSTDRSERIQKETVW